MGPASQAMVRVPYAEEREINGAHYRIRVPRNWNGTLLLFAHGYRLWNLPDPWRKGQLAPRSRYDFFEQTDRSDDAAEKALIKAGYALAGSAYRSNGFAVREGVEDTVALANYFRETVGEPEQTLVYGLSMGGVVTAKCVEEHPELFDGGVALASYDIRKLADAFLGVQIAGPICFSLQKADILLFWARWAT